MKSEKREIIKDKKILQAVILADDFTEDLAPMNEYHATVLTPVANTPLLDYLVETLMASKVQEIYLYCTNYVEELKKRVNMLKSIKNVSINMLINEGCYSLGDAMRDIDSKGKIRGDFILIRANALINANLQHFIHLHRQREKEDKGAIMTVIMQNVGYKRNSSLEENMYFVVSDEKTRKMTYYDKISAGDDKVVLKRRNLIISGSSRMNTDMLDTHVYICSPAVLSQFSDNFDFQTMDDFIKGIIVNEEILDSRIFWEPLNFKSWGIPLTSWKAYNTANRDVLRRQFFPLVPETINYRKEYEVSVSQCFYNHHSSKTERCNLIHNSIVGEDSSIGQNSSVSGSVIGQNCKIGDNVIIENSYIISNATIGDNVSIKESVVFHDSSVPNNATIDGCIVAAKTNIDPKISSFKDCLIKSEDGTIKPRSLKMDHNIDSEDPQNQNIRFFKSFVQEEEEEDEICESSSDEENENDANEDDEEDLDSRIFLGEVSDSLLRGYQEKLNTENLILEINSSRYAYNVKLNDVTRIVTKCILKLPLRYLQEANIQVTTSEYLKTLKGVVTFFEDILRKYNKSAVSEQQVLKAFEEVASSTELFMPVLKNVLHYFYEKDFLSENSILEWFEKYEENDAMDKLNMNIKVAVQAFVDWLREAEEDDSDEDSDSD